MPPLPPAPFTIRVDMTHTEAGDPGLQNRTFWRYSAAAPSNGDLNILATTVSNLWNTLVSQLAHPDTALVEVVCTDLSSPTGGRGSWTGSHVGTRTGGALPDNVCTLLNFQIQRRYRGGKPRIYAPWGTATDVASGEQQWNASFVSIVNTVWGQVSSNLNGTGFGGSVLHEQQNVSYYQGVNKNGDFITLPSGRVKNVPIVRPAPVIDPIAGHTCNIILGSQRRRLRV